MSLFRIVQLSDIHLSAENLADLQNKYIDSLLNDLSAFHKETPIDIILITGDLLDRGGQSLQNDDKYKIFQENLVDPILRKLNISRNQILFIAGNHDVDRNLIDEKTEFFLAKKLDRQKANDLLPAMKSSFIDENRRVQAFKIFEKEFHNTTANYVASNNQSTFIYEKDHLKIGFALINDSWRCSNELTKDNHFVGTNQVWESINYLESNQTNVNIAVFHHPLDAFNEEEKVDIETALKSKNYHLAIFGHTHRQGYESLVTPAGGYISISGRTAFNDLSEGRANYQPGYNILDISLPERQITVYARKYILNGNRFDADTDSMQGGVFKDNLDNSPYVLLGKKNSTPLPQLPSGYSADVNTIVRLLIGKSLYTDRYTFVRELIQNSVDACARILGKHSNLSPKIIVRINTEQNYFEISDDGDGMSLKVIRDQFSVIGKSISQEYFGDKGLIAQFGIGFISTFIVAEKVIVETSSEENGKVRFSITDVFEGFEYESVEQGGKGEIDHTGTTVLVYLKKEFPANAILQHVKRYCRHISNLEVYLDSSIQPHTNSWNIEGGLFPYEIKGNSYELKLAISPVSRAIIASNSGFLITISPNAITPFLFPSIIGGEINFTPKAIDCDISRTNIIETDKSKEFRKTVSIGLRRLFRDVLESNNKQLKDQVLIFLQYYLINYDQLKAQFDATYHDFYSRRELADLCLMHLEFNFEGRTTPLDSILRAIAARGTKVIYFRQAHPLGDIDDTVGKLLFFKGQFVFTEYSVNVQFREGGRAFTILTVLQLICGAQGFTFENVQNMPTNTLRSLSISRDVLPARISEELTKIEHLTQKAIILAELEDISKPVLFSRSTLILNYHHTSFKKLLTKEREISDEILRVYLCGLLGLIPEEWMP